MKKTILIAAVMFFAFSVAAFAQASFQVASTPVISVASCGTTELTGDIAFTQVAGSPPIQTGTITINYGVPITALVKSDGTAGNVTVFDSTGATITTIPLVLSFFGGGNVAGNMLTFTVGPSQVATGTPPYTYRVSGVRVNVAGNTGLTSLSASVSSTVNLFVGGQTNVTVISSIAPAVSYFSTTFPAPFQLPTTLNINAVSTGGLGTVTAYIQEGFANAFVLNQMIGLTFSAIPAGIKLSVPRVLTSSDGTVFQASDSTGALLATAPGSLDSTSTALTIYYKVVTTGDVATAGTLAVPITVGLVTFPPSPLPQGTVTLTMDLYPKLGAFPDYAGSKIPQYSGTNCQKGPITIVNILTANTVLLVPYAVYSSGYDTGLAISNTTKDPLSSTQAAVAQSGSITFTFYPQTGSSFAYTTSASSPGAGLTNGNLAAGGLYTVLLSQLLAAAGGPATFSGYIFAVVNATDCHGQYFISDFEAFTNGALMPVVNSANRKGQVSVPESLGF